MGEKLDPMWNCSKLVRWCVHHLKEKGHAEISLQSVTEEKVRSALYTAAKWVNVRIKTYKEGTMMIGVVQQGEKEN